jgi:hypothetical protein
MPPNPGIRNELATRLYMNNKEYPILSMIHSNKLTADISFITCCGSQWKLKKVR